MGISIKSKLFYTFIRKAMKKYAGNEQAYIDKRLQGQAFEPGSRRESKYKVPEGYGFARCRFNGVNHEFLKRMVLRKRKSSTCFMVVPIILL